MSEKAFRLDFFIAIAALLVSGISAIALLYQTHVIGQQYAATIWPYLSVTANLSDSAQQLTISNDGLGPALIRSAQLTVDGKQLANWNDYLNILSSGTPKGAKALASLSSIGPATTIRPGESMSLFEIKSSSPIFSSIVLKHRVELSFCYCSLNGTCWLLHAIPGSNLPPVNAVHPCTTSTGIGSYATFPSAPPRRK